MMNGLILVSLLVVAGQASPDFDKSQYPNEQLAVGTIRSIISAQAAYRHTKPEAGYACDIETLVKADMLIEAMSNGKSFDGYVFRVWCEQTSTPQATFRASAVPAAMAVGSSLTVCTDESNVPRTIAGDVAACFVRGRGPR